MQRCSSTASRAQQMLAALRALGVAILIWTAKDRQTLESLWRIIPHQHHVRPGRGALPRGLGWNRALDYAPTQNHPGRSGPTAAGADPQTYSRRRLLDGCHSPLTASETFVAPQELFVYPLLTVSADPDANFIVYGACPLRTAVVLAAGNSQRLRGVTGGGSKLLLRIG